jgi:hypothetical protein
MLEVVALNSQEVKNKELPLLELLQKILTY